MGFIAGDSNATRNAIRHDCKSATVRTFLHRVSYCLRNAITFAFRIISVSHMRHPTIPLASVAVFHLACKCRWIFVRHHNVVCCDHFRRALTDACKKWKWAIDVYSELPSISISGSNLSKCFLYHRHVFVKRFCLYLVFAKLNYHLSELCTIICMWVWFPFHFEETAYDAGICRWFTI